MISILTAVFCLHHFCIEQTIPTEINLTSGACNIIGSALSQQYTPPHWRLRGFYCIEGRFI